MIKVNIMNLPGFFETINRCRGRVMMLAPDGTKVNLTRQYPVQQELEKQYRQNGKRLPLSLFFDSAGFYIASFLSAS